MRRMAAGAVLLAGWVTATITAQQPEYRVEVRLVEVEARVTDAAGRQLTGLQRGDFALKENGVKHDIATVSYMTSAERTLAVPAAARNADTPPFVTVAPSPTWVFIQAEADPTDVPRVRDALRRFVSAPLQPGFRVSIGGRAFTDDPQRLMEIVEQLARGPFGGNGGPGLIDPTAPQQQDAEEERAMATDMRKQEEGIVPIPGFVARPEKVEETAQFGRPFLTESRIDRQLPMYGEVALRRYEDLVSRLSPLPGKKVVVLLRPGLRVEADNVSALRRIASRAAMHRVSFYTMNSRGLETLIPTTDRVVPLGLDRRRRFTIDVAGMMEQRDLAEEGLTALAVATNGRDIPATNDLGSVFQAVSRDATGYYVLGYYPVDLTASGRYRRIKVTVSRPGTRVEATSGYYEPSASLASSGDKGLSLRKALLTALPRDLAVAANAAVFAWGDGSPALVLSAGVRANALKAGGGKAARRLEATALVRIVSEDGATLPIHFERRLSSAADGLDWDRLQHDPRALVALSDVIALAPGKHTWRVVFRDENTGRLGGAEGQVVVPDYRAGTTVSTLLMTGDVMRRVNEQADGDDVLDVGPLRFAPQPTRVFRQGDTVHLLFDVYNPAAEDLAAGPQGPRVALLLNGRRIADPEAQGQAFPDALRRRIRYACAISTRGLDAGSYTVIVAPPRPDASGPRPLVQVFMLLPS
jgi:VWFA-related protein